MKWIRRAVLFVVLLACVLGIAVFWTALRSERPVGFQIVQAADPNGQPFAIGVWYPTEARTWPTTWLGLGMMDVARDAPVSGRGLPLVVVSHGNGGGPGSHADLAMALAGAGYIVAAPMHPGDNYMDQSAAGTVGWISGRNRQVRVTIDYLLKDWPGHAYIDQGRIGAFGFSAGAATMLTTVGAKPDLGRIAQYCTGSAEFICGLLRDGKSALLNPGLAGKGNDFAPDPRIKAAVIAAPGLGFLMDSAALEQVSVPVQLWSGDQDQSVPYATNSKAVREALGSGAEFHAIPGAGHFSFLVPCGILGPPLLCADEGEFDRKAFHTKMNAAVIEFLGRHLKRSGT